MTSLFSGCKMLEDLPDDIFKNMAKASRAAISTKVVSA